MQSHQMRVRFQRKWSWFGLLVGMLTGVAASVWADSPVQGTGSAPGPGGFGGVGDVPTPFRASNQKVELAPGERYHLVGWIRILNGAPYLEIDFSEHSWLMSQARAQWPYYSLEVELREVLPLQGLRVRVFAESHANILRDRETKSYSYVLSLQPLQQIRRLR